jgi:hypothetical protein
VDHRPQATLSGRPARTRRIACRGVISKACLAAGREESHGPDSSAPVTAAGLVTFRLSISALEEFRQETVEESKRIEAVRYLLVEADDLGEAAVEESDPATGRQFVALSA